MERDISDLPALPHFLGLTGQKSTNLLRKTNDFFYEVTYYFYPALFPTDRSKEMHVIDCLLG